MRLASPLEQTVLQPLVTQASTAVLVPVWCLLVLPQPPPTIEASTTSLLEHTHSNGMTTDNESTAWRPYRVVNNIENCRVGEQTMYEIGQEPSCHHVFSMIKYDISAGARKLSVLFSGLCAIHFLCRSTLVSTNVPH